MNKIINICFASDNWYAEHLLVAIFSLIYNLDKNYIANIFILDWWINEENKNLFTSLEKKFNNLKINFIKIDNEIYNKLPPLHLTKEMYYRIEIPEILKNISTVLYLDCDIIVKGDISKIFDYNIDDYAIWAPNDIWTYYYYKEVQNIPSENEYFNSWVLLINLNYFRKNNLSNKIFDYIKTHNLLTWDQDAINAILWDKRLVLPLKYNALDWVFIWPKNKLFIEKELSEARNNPVIIHYAWSKPWKKYCTHPLKNKYHEFRKLTWLDTIKLSKKIEIRTLIKNLIWLFWIYLLNSISRKYYYIIFKVKQFISNLFN